jgi:hypothetical protein
MGLRRGGFSQNSTAADAAHVRQLMLRGVLLGSARLGASPLLPCFLAFFRLTGA